MRREKNDSFESEGTLLGAIWNIIYGLFLFIVVYGGLAFIGWSIVIGLLVIGKAIILGIYYGGAAGFPYI